MNPFLPISINLGRMRSIKVAHCSFSRRHISMKGTNPFTRFIRARWLSRQGKFSYAQNTCTYFVCTIVSSIVYSRFKCEHSHWLRLIPSVGFCAGRTNICQIWPITPAQSPFLDLSWSGWGAATREVSPNIYLYFWWCSCSMLPTNINTSLISTEWNIFITTQWYQLSTQHQNRF